MSSIARWFGGTMWLWLAAISDLWRHFRSPSWICGDVISGRHLGFVMTSLPAAISDFAEVTSGRLLGFMVTSLPVAISKIAPFGGWRPEVTSPLIQDGNRKWRHHNNKMAASIWSCVASSHHEIVQYLRTIDPSKRHCVIPEMIAQFQNDGLRLGIAQSPVILCNTINTWNIQYIEKCCSTLALFMKYLNILQINGTYMDRFEL